MDDEPNVWEQHAKRLRRQEQLDKLNDKHPVLFTLSVFLISAIVGVIAIGLRYWLDRLSP